MFSGVSTHLGVTTNKKQVMMPGMSLYTTMPADSKCIFSLNEQVREKRSLQHVLPKRDAVAWDQARIQAKADAIRKEYPSESKSIVRPVMWEQLYEFFDAHDLYFEGAWNLWAVIKQICNENSPDGGFDQGQCDIVADWAYKWLTHNANLDQLGTWDKNSDILDILSRQDWGSIGDCGPKALDVLRGEFLHWHCYYFDVKPQDNQSSQPPRKGKKSGGKQAKNSKNGANNKPFGEVSVNPEHRLAALGKISTLPLKPSMSLAPILGGLAPILEEQRSVSVPPEVAMGAPTFEKPAATESGNGEFTAKEDLGVDERSGPAAHQTRKSRHQPSKSGPVPADLKLADLHLPDMAAGPSRLPSRHRPEALSPGQPAAQAGLSQDVQKPQPEVPEVPDGSFTSAKSVTAADQVLPAAAIHASGPSQGNNSRPAGFKQGHGKPSKRGHGQQGPTAHGNSGDLRQHRPYHHRSSNQNQGSGGSGSCYPQPPFEHQQRGTGREREPVPSDCRNKLKAGLWEDYLSCDCPRCERQSRSIFIAGLNVTLSATQKIDTLKRFYSRWGKVEDCELSDHRLKRLPLWAALVTFVSTEPVAAAVQHTNSTEIPGLATRARVSYPFYSKFYQQPPQRASYGAPLHRALMANVPHNPAQPLAVEDMERLAQQYPQFYQAQQSAQQHGVQQHHNAQQPPNSANGAAPPALNKAAPPNSKAGKRRPSGFSESKIGFSDGSPRIVTSQPNLADPFVGEPTRRVGSGMMDELKPLAADRGVPVQSFAGLPVIETGNPRIPPNGYSNVPHVPSPSGHLIPQSQHGYPPQHGYLPQHGQFISPRGQAAGFRFGPSGAHPGYLMPQPGHPQPGHPQFMHAPPYGTPGAPGAEVGAGGRNPYAPSFQPAGPPGMYALPHSYHHPPPHGWYPPVPPYPMPMGYGMPPQPPQFAMEPPQHRQAHAPQGTSLPVAQKAPRHNLQSKQPSEEALSDRERSPEVADNLGIQDIRVRLPNRPARTPPKQTESPDASKTGESEQPGDVPLTLDQFTSSDDGPEFIKEALAALNLGFPVAITETAVAEKISAPAEEQKDEPESDETAGASSKPQSSRYRYASQDIRAEPGFMNQTVIRRRVYGHHRVFSEWQDQGDAAATEDVAEGDEAAAAQVTPKVLTAHRDAATNQFWDNWNSPAGYGQFHHLHTPPPPERSSIEVHQEELQMIEQRSLLADKVTRKNGNKKSKSKKKGTQSDASRPSTPSLPAESNVEPHAQGDIPPIQANPTSGPAAQGKKKAKSNEPKVPSNLGKALGKNSTADRNKPLAAAEPQHSHPQEGNNSGLQVPADMGYRGGKAGALRPTKTRTKGVSHLQNLFNAEDEPSTDGESTATRKGNQKAADPELERAGQPDDANHHGSFRGLPKSFDPWPRKPSDGRISPQGLSLPKVIVQPPDRSPPESSALPALGEHSHDNNIQRISAHSHRDSDYFSAKSSFSSRENSPPTKDKTEPELGSPPATGIQQPKSQANSPKPPPGTPTQTKATGDKSTAAQDASFNNAETSNAGAKSATVETTKEDQSEAPADVAPPPVVENEGQLEGKASNASANNRGGKRGGKRGGRYKKRSASS